VAGVCPPSASRYFSLLSLALTLIAGSTGLLVRQHEIANWNRWPNNAMW
jgi:hypothetical protein